MRLVLKTLVSTLIFSAMMNMANAQPINLYLVPGMANDHRLFGEYQFDTTLVRPIPIKWVDWKNVKGFGEYAKLLSAQIDTTAPFVLLGFSMGGILSMEMSRFLKPKAIILVSSVKSSKNLPFRVKFARYLPLYRLMSEGMVRKASKRKWFFKTIKSEQHVKLYQSMVADTGAKFFKWQLCATAHWKFDLAPKAPPIYHIHGDKDQVIPLKKSVHPDYVVKDGPHEIIINDMKLLTGLVEGYVRGVK
ncbi:MAG: alpha/beta hydrolase [Saprospiraceae bacterium]|nr:alpha/beta hydrolase [Saprospiraceae bacterium]